MFERSATNYSRFSSTPVPLRRLWVSLRLALTGLLVLCGAFAPLLSADAAGLDNPDEAGELMDDTRQVPPEFRNMAAMSASAASAPGYFDTSVFMIGKVAVGVVLPESDGHAENWTDAELDQVLSKIRQGTDQWVAWGGAGANLEFVFDVHTRVPTTYEPIQLASTQDHLWVNETLGALGFSSAYSLSSTSMYDRLYKYTDYLRRQYQSQWAFVIFVADSSADVDGKFSDNRFGYAYYFGPMVVMTYDNGGWSINNMNWITAHEIGHIFGAADQYSGACFGSEHRFGYLGVANSNCRGPVPSLMRDGAYYGPDQTTRGQVGWLDSDGDGLFDPVDTTLSFSLNPYAPNPTKDANLVYTGSITDLPRLHADCTYCYGRDININTITAVEFRIDNGAWQAAAAEDGAFDSGNETFTFATGEIPEGYHTIDVRASNSSQMAATWTDTVAIGDVSPFADVPTGYWAQNSIAALSNAGITSGCSTNPLMYCPSSPVTRAQMAVFLLRGIHGGSYTPPAATGAIFSDVPGTHWAAAWIEQLYHEGITSGCGAGNYCPESAVTRDQMAVFLLRSKHGSAFTPAPATGAFFDDADASYWATAWIEQLAAEGITSGCGNGNYCPGNPVLREQMAVFLQRTFGLPLP